jgi:DNA replication and repair protein RecF
VRIHSLSLCNYRNYGQLDLNFGDAAQIALIGLNAQGKTNLLEAIYALAFASSPRTRHIDELVRWGASHALIQGQCESRLGPLHLELRLTAEGKRSARVNHQIRRRLGDYVGHLKLVFFSGRDLYMLTGSPQERRQFLDLLLIQIYPAYYFSLQTYQRLLKQRNALLKQLKLDQSCSSQLFEQLGLWELQLSQYGASIITRRRQLLKALTPYVAQAHARISHLKESIHLQYVSAIPGIEGASQAEVQLALYELLSQHRTQDIVRVQTSYGPHRDDLRIFLEGKELKSFGSQGQLRSAALAMKMAEVLYLQGIFQDAPLLLLDDVFSELDPQRQQATIEMIRGPEVQTLLTTTHLDGPVQQLFDQQGKIYHIQAGQVHVG